MITNADKLFVSYEELESLFNEALAEGINEWTKEKNDFFKDPFNKNKRPTGNYLPDADFRMWLKVPQNLVPAQTFNALRTEIENAGWKVSSYQWMKDERTDEDQIYIHIKKK